MMARDDVNTEKTKEYHLVPEEERMQALLTRYLSWDIGTEIDAQEEIREKLVEWLRSAEVFSIAVVCCAVLKDESIAVSVEDNLGELLCSILGAKKVLKVIDYVPKDQKIALGIIAIEELANANVPVDK